MKASSQASSTSGNRGGGPVPKQWSEMGSGTGASATQASTRRCNRRNRCRSHWPPQPRFASGGGGAATAPVAAATAPQVVSSMRAATSPWWCPQQLRMPAVAVAKPSAQTRRVGGRVPRGGLRHHIHILAPAPAHRDAHVYTQRGSRAREWCTAAQGVMCSEAAWAMAAEVMCEQWNTRLTLSCCIKAPTTHNFRASIPAERHCRLSTKAERKACTHERVTLIRGWGRSLVG